MSADLGQSIWVSQPGSGNLADARSGRRIRQQSSELFNGFGDAPLQAILQTLVTVEICFGPEDTSRRRYHVEKREERPQMRLDHQGMTGGAAGRGQDRRLAGQRFRFEQIEEM